MEVATKPYYVHRYLPRTRDHLHTWLADTGEVAAESAWRDYSSLFLKEYQRAEIVNEFRVDIWWITSKLTRLSNLYSSK